MVACLSCFFLAGAVAWGKDATPATSQSAAIIGQRDQLVTPAAFQRGRGAGFDLRNATIPTKRIQSGGVAKDGIPALTNPKHIAPQEAKLLEPDDRVIGVVLHGEARAYPLNIMSYHEIANDRIGKVPFAVTYCPLCDSAAVFDRRTDKGELEFGVSGLLYNSNVLMYDRGSKPEGLWSQLKAEGVTGPGSGQSLKALAVELTTWRSWLARHPDTTVLSAETGFARDYSQDFYASYFRTPKLMFPVRPTSRRMPAKTPVLGVWTDGAARAYPISAFGRQRQTLAQEIDGLDFSVEWDPAARALRVSNADAGVQWMYSFWFAWYAFRPKTELFKQPRH